MVTIVNKKLITSVLIAVLFTSISTLAQNSKNRVIEATIEYKCHVELLGGIQTIDFVSVKEQNLQSLASSLVGKKKFKPFTRMELPIYKAFECVKLNEKFSNNRSNAIDKKTTR
jgi:hypothetical protein